MFENDKNQNDIVNSELINSYDIEYIFNDNTKIECTDDHPFYIVGDSEVDSDYKAPLRLDDKIMKDDLTCAELVGWRPRNKGRVKTYNLGKLSNNNNYFANRVLVSDESDTE